MVTVRLTVPLAVAEFDNVALLPDTELIVVLEGIPVPVTASPDTTALGNVPEMVTVGEPEVVVTPTIRRFGPKLVSEPQSVILEESVAHQSR
jgi:hypothetical protein